MRRAECGMRRAEYGGIVPPSLTATADMQVAGHKKCGETGHNYKSRAVRLFRFARNDGL